MAVDYVDLVEARRDMEAAADLVAQRKRELRSAGTDFSDFKVRAEKVAAAAARLDEAVEARAAAQRRFEELRSQ